jgi:tetratricopeptide (TPR) repeat protein
MHNIYKSKAHGCRMQELRIKYLQEEIENFPDDPFNYYALAIEYAKKKPEEASVLFDTLVEKFPEYLPTYYQAANFFFELQDLQKAEILFQKGIELAQKQDNPKTLRELEGSYSIFKMETDDEY